MTCREKLAIEHPEKINDELMGGCEGCPHEYGYIAQYMCSCHTQKEGNCTDCWDREIPETGSINQVSFETTSANTYHPEQLNLHKLIDEAMEKKDREVSIFIMKDTMSVYVRPVGSNDPRWIVHDNGGRYFNRTYICSECRTPSDDPTPYCPHCGEKLRMPVPDDNKVESIPERSVEDAKDDGESDI